MVKPDVYPTPWLLLLVFVSSLRLLVIPQFSSSSSPSFVLLCFFIDASWDLRRVDGSSSVTCVVVPVAEMPSPDIRLVRAKFVYYFFDTAIDWNADHI